MNWNKAWWTLLLMLLIVLILIAIFLITIPIINAEKFKINNTVITIDEGLDKVEIIAFVDNFDLSKINAIYFLKYERPYNAMLWTWGYYRVFQIHIFNMETIDWRGSFKEVYDVQENY